MFSLQNWDDTKASSKNYFILHHSVVPEKTVCPIQI